VALALDRPELEGEGGAQRVLGGDHHRAGQLGGAGQGLHLQAYQIRHEQEQPAAARGEARVRNQPEAAHVGHRLRGGCWAPRAFLVQAPGQRGEAFRA
jgi:hypothetical protein